MQEPITEFIFIVVPLSVIFSFGALIPFLRYTGLGRDKAYFALLTSVIVGDFQGYLNVHRIASAMQGGGSSPFEMELRLIAAGLIVPLVTAFVFRLWGRWIGGRATAEERRPGAAGIQAWFGTSNITVALLIVLCAWLGQDVSPLLTSVILVALLAAQPLLGLDLASPASVAAQGPGLASVPRPRADDLSAEREKIISMLEAGKLTPEESAELLQALGESSRAAAPQVPLSSHQRLMLIGAALVALGFFLPWFVIDAGKELSRTMQQTTFAFANQQDSNLLRAMGNPVFSTPNVSISGGDIQRGLGWAALILAGAAALLPYVATTLDTATARIVRLLCLGLGAFMVVYLLSQNMRFVGVGLIIVLAGYALEIVGALRERQLALR